MSPEQVVEQAVDARSDVFSVGVVLAELLTGRRLFAAPNELDVLLMVRDAKLSRLDKYGMDIEPALNELVRKALRKSADERWQSAAAFRDALGEWLFDHRHRMTNKHVADVVHELRDAVAERRGRAEGMSTAILDDHADKAPEAEPEVVVARAPSETDGAPIMVIEAGDSMPVISVSYDAGADDSAPASNRPVSVSDLAATAVTPPVATAPRARSPVQVPAMIPTASDVVVISDSGPPIVPRLPSSPARATPAQGTPRTSPPTPPPPAKPPGSRTVTPDQPVTARTATSERERMRTNPLEGMQPLARPATSPFTRKATISEDTTPSGDLSSMDGAVEIPIGDTISAAVEAIMEPSVRSDASRTDDSVARAFDDLTEEPRRRFEGELPSPEELARKRPPTPPALSDIPEPPDDSGEFASTSPLRVLFRLMTARATGLLVVAIGGIKKEIYVRDGQPEYVSSNVASELFGNYLVTKGVLSDGELAMALAMMPHYGGKLGDTLVGLGLLKPLEVFRHLTRQVRSKIIDVCTWNKGGFGWYAGRENPREAFPLDFNAFEILGAGAMALADEVIETWVAKNNQVRLRASRTRRVGPERFEVKGLVELFETLDGRRSIGDLVELHTERSERIKAGRMLCLLEACDLAKAS